MSDQEFKVGDYVSFDEGDGALFGEGTVVSVDGSFLEIEMPYGLIYKTMSWFVRPVKNSSHSPFHECVPYVGPMHVENKCVHCNSYLHADVVHAYLRKVGF